MSYTLWQGKPYGHALPNYVIEELIEPRSGVRVASWELGSSRPGWEGSIRWCYRLF